MKKISIFAAVLALLTLSLNAQLNTAKKAVVKPKTTTEKKVDMPQDGFKMYLQPEGFRAPKRATETKTVTFTAGTNTANANTITLDGVTITSTHSTTNNSFNYNPYRFYAGSVAISTDAGNITNIVFNGTATQNPVSRLSTTTGNYTTSNNVGTWTGSASSVSFTSSGQVRCSSIVVTVETETGGGGETGETSTLNLFDTTAYVAQVLPVYGYWYDAAQHNQMIYPASLLTDMVGKTIKSMTFYPASYNSYKGINFYNGTITFKLMEVNGSTGFASTSPSYITGTMTTVSTVSMPTQANTNATTWLITFDQDYEYHGGDLVVDVTTTAGDYGYTYFYIGTTSSLNVANPGLLQYSTNAAQAVGYVPRVTFTYEGESVPRHDLGIALSAQPTTVSSGNAITLTATVTNTGNQTEEGYTVTFTAGGTTIATQTASEPLAAGATATFTTTYNTNEAQAGQTVNFGASVACTDDADATNNDATASAQVITLPPPENVAATGAASSGTMTWDAPTAIAASSVTEGFEDTSMFPEFSLGGITATQHTGAIGDWTLYDSTGSTVYGYESITVPNLGSPMAWMVFAPGSSQLSQSLADTQAAHNGNQMMASYCPDNSTTASDHWLISPLLSGDAQTISFFARELTDQYGGETFEVLYSTTDNNPASFTGVALNTSATSTDWAEFTAELPAGAKYFAIRHTSTDVFALFVDDITYIPAQMAPVSYNIYLDGQLVDNVSASTYSYTFNNVEGEHQCAVSAVYALGESVAVPATFTTVAKTATPEITYTSDGDNVVITATGNGTVTLTVNGQTVSGEGAASITVPCGVEATTVTATATAQEAGKLISDTQTLTVNIPAGQGWTVMDGEYNNPNDLLSFLKDEEDIMMIDQFIASTLNNDHPAGYTYTLVETVNGEDKVSTPVTVPVYKTNSAMKGFYSYNQIMADTDMHLQAGVVNAEMDYGVHPDRNSLYYSLYRDRKVSDGTMTANTYPAIEIPYRVSQLQKYDEKVGDQVQYFFTETHSTGITPKYDAIGTQTVELLDTNYVQVGAGEEMSYVPVIWTFGLYTARGDGKNNSYGSDIKTEKLGEVGATYDAYYTTGDYGKFKVGNVEYCIYYPEIKVTGTLPAAKVVYNDDDEAVYTPFMYRAWCTYPGARNFTLDSDGHLIDAGALITAESPAYLLQTEIDETRTEVTLGGDTWKPGQPKEQWAFGVPVEGVNPSDITFVVRFYYKKTTSEVAPNGLRNQRAEGDDDHAYYIVETRGSVDRVITAVNELYGAGVEPVSVTYVNAQGMQSSKPFDGINIVVTRYSDGSTTTSKIVR